MGDGNAIGSTLLWSLNASDFTAMTAAHHDALDFALPLGSRVKVSTTATVAGGAAQVVRDNDRHRTCHPRAIASPTSLRQNALNQLLKHNLSYRVKAGSAIC